MKQKLVRFIAKDGKDHWPIHIDEVSGYLHYVKKHEGNKIQFSTGCKEEHLNRAKRIINEELAKRLGKKKVVRVQSLIKEETPLWVSLKSGQGLAEDSIKNVRNGVKQFEAFWGNKFPIEMLNPDTRAEFYAWFQTAYPGQQMENAIKQIRGFCGYLAEKVVNGVPILPTRPSFSDPAKKEIRRARKRKKARIITAEEFKKIHSVAHNLEEQILVLLMYTMATRVTETLSLAFESEIILYQMVPIYRWSDGQNKADLDGFHALHPALLGPLTRLHSIRRTEGTNLLFPQQRDNQKPLKEQQIDWDGWRKRAALGWHWTPHTFRHTCLSNLFNDERNPQATICKLYRVSLAVALETYVKPTESSIEKMREAIKVDL